ncbi:unnamed protein product [Rhizophagus irregularis]|nr:unnamed protein product [Rhizophagus irregularis]
MTIIITILVGFVGILIYLLIKYPDRSIGTNPRRDLNGPKGLPLFGNLFDVLKHDNNGFVIFLYETLMKYGPNATYTLPGFGRFITVNNPECLEHVMKANFEGYVKGEKLYKILYDLLGDGIFNTSGDNWKMQRKLFSLRWIHLENFKCLTNTDSPVKFAQSFDFVQGALGKRLQNSFWNITELFTEEGRKLREDCKYLTEFAYQIIENRRKNPETLREATDVLNLFMEAKYDNGENMTDKQLIDVVLNFIIAGRDSTAQTLSWMMYNIMVNPSIEEKLVKEANSLLSDEEPISRYENIKQFQYTHATLYETLRLHPTVPNNFRVCLKDDVLPNGIPIYAGEMVNWSSWAAGRDERTWGKDAKIFNPERFLNSEDGLKPSPYKFTSFNCGPRICLGQNFATTEAIMLATAVLRQYKFEMVPGQKLPPDFGVSLTLPMKNPLLVKVYHR